MKKAATEFYVKFLVAVITSPKFGIRLGDINASISANRRRQIANQLAEAGFITPYNSRTKGRRWMMSDILSDLLSNQISQSPEILIELTKDAELKFPERFADIEEAADTIRSAEARRQKKLGLSRPASSKQA